MKKLSDYKGSEAIELWGDLIESMSEIFSDQEVIRQVNADLPTIIIATTILKKHSESVSKALLRIDPEPLNGLNILVRTISLLSEIGQIEGISSFFGFAEQEKTGTENTGSHMENT